MRDLLLFFSTPLLTLIFSTAFLVIWSRDKSRVENLGLSIGWFMMTSGFSISILSPEHWGRAIPAITHVPYTLAAIALSWGLLKRVKVQPPLTAQLWIAFIGFVTMMVVQNIGNSILADLYITNLTCAAIMLITAQLFAQTAGRDLVERFLLTMIILASAQFFIRPIVSLMFDGPIAAEAYRESTYYLVLYWVLGFGSVLFGLAQIAGAVKDQVTNLRRENACDDLTGLLGRGAFEAQVQSALTKASAQDINASLVICDIDHFKQVNDIWGHQAGDEAIEAFGHMAGDMIRSSDIAGRVGGEEFCILVWNADEDIAARLAERLRVRTNGLEIGDSALDVRLTASFGVAQQVRGESYYSLFARADAALYNAKQTGRNCVSTASQDCTARDNETSEINGQCQSEKASEPPSSETFSLNQDLTDNNERYVG